MSKGALRYPSPESMPEGMRKLYEAAHSPPRQSVSRLSPLKRHQIVSPDPVALKWGQPVKKLRHVKHESGVMNKTEARYAQHLDALIVAGDVAAWKFESVKIRLAKRTWLTIDFFVWMPDGAVELHEVKGRKGKRYFATEDSKLKVKVAAEEYPRWTVRIVWPAKGGGWDQELIG